MSGTRSIESRQLYRAVPDAVTELGPEEDDLGRESRCGAVALGRTYLLPPLSSGGALLVRPWLRFHIPLIEPDRQISRIRLVWGFLCQGGRHANLVVLYIPFFCSTRAASTLPSRPHISIAVAAQRRSRTALLQRRRRLVLDGREHGGRLPAIGWLAVR